MNGDKESGILQFVRDELSANRLGIGDALTSGNSITVFEDIFAMIERFSGGYGVDCSSVDWLKSYPPVGIPFLPNFLWPAKLKTDHTPPAPLTVKCLLSQKGWRFLFSPFALSGGPCWV